MIIPHDFKNRRKIPLFYWSERRFIFREKENYGDLLSKYLVEKISGKETRFVHPRKQSWYRIDKSNLVAIGSIIHHASKDSIVWGSGIIDKEQDIQKADFRAVRGPRTRKYLLELGYDCPQVFGDPALLLPDYYKPAVPKKYKIGIVPHYHDYEKALKIFADKGNVKVVDLLTMDVEATTLEILECDRIVSTSLHGLIVSHAYGIPAIWIKISNKIFGNDIKYVDYLESVGMETYEAEIVEEGISEEKLLELFKKYPSIISKAQIDKIKSALLSVKPF